MSNNTDEKVTIATEGPQVPHQAITVEQWGKLFRALAGTHPSGPLDQITAVLETLGLTVTDAEEGVNHQCQQSQAEAWEVGVATALNHAIRNDDGITLRLEHTDGRPWKNPYREQNS